MITSLFPSSPRPGDVNLNPFVYPTCLLSPSTNDTDTETLNHWRWMNLFSYDVRSLSLRLCPALMQGLATGYHNGPTNEFVSGIVWLADTLLWGKRGQKWIPTHPCAEGDGCKVNKHSHLCIHLGENKACLWWVGTVLVQINLERGLPIRSWRSPYE